MRRWIVWVLAATFVIFTYAQQVFPDIVATQLASDFHASKSTLGDISAAYFIAYATLQIPIGMSLDRIGIRIPLTIAIFLGGVSSILFAFAQTSEVAILARLLMGACASFSFLGCLKLVQGWFPVSRFSTMAGLTNTAAMLGAASGIPIAILVGTIGWRSATALLGDAQIALAAVVLLLVRDQAPETELRTLPSSQRPSDAEPIAKVVTSFLSNPQVWLNALYATSISLVLVAFGDLWGVSFIEKSYGADAIKAADVGTCLFAGGMIGSMFFGWFADFIGSRKKTMILAAVGGLASMIPTLLGTNIPLPLFEAGLFLIGFFTGASIVPYAVARELHPDSSGLSIGFLSTCTYAGCALSQPLLGYMLQLHSKSSEESTLASLTIADYQFAFTSLIFFMGIGLVTSFILKDTGQRT